MQLLIATRNAHKTSEIAAMLGSGWEVQDLTSYPEIRAPDETGATFQENAQIKACAAARLFPGWVLADDSGLEVDALNGAPGVRSARYAGDDASDAANRALLAKTLIASGTVDRTARFCCAMVLAREREVLGSFFGTVAGRILEEVSGTGGFGYDALFVPVGESLSFAQLPAETKNRLSHRARALSQVIDYLRQYPGVE